MTIARNLIELVKRVGISDKELLAILRGETKPTTHEDGKADSPHTIQVEVVGILVPPDQNSEFYLFEDMSFIEYTGLEFFSYLDGKPIPKEEESF